MQPGFFSAIFTTRRPVFRLYLPSPPQGIRPGRGRVTRQFRPHNLRSSIMPDTIELNRHGPSREASFLLRHPYRHGKRVPHLWGTCRWFQVRTVCLPQNIPRRVRRLFPCRHAGVGSSSPSAYGDGRTVFSIAFHDVQINPRHVLCCPPPWPCGSRRSPASSNSSSAGGSRRSRFSLRTAWPWPQVRRRGFRWCGRQLNLPSQRLVLGVHRARWLATSASILL